MKKFAMVALAALTVVGLCTATALAQGGTDPNNYPGRTHVKVDTEAMKSMTPEERRAAMQAYKQAREAEARQAGETPTSIRGLQRLDSPRTVKAPERPEVPGTNITYDTGTVLGFTGVASQMVGNRFDNALNPAGTMCCFPVETSGSVTMVTFDMVNTFFGSVVLSIYSDVVGTMAAQVTSMARPGIMTGLNTLSLNSTVTANAYMNGTFLAGVWQFDPTMTGVGVDSGSTGGQGFHAISINDGASGTMLTTVTTGGMGLNAVFRVSGNVATPVELMHFEITDD